MLNPQDERALRRLVADLAVATPADIEAVLASLSAQERGQIETLFESYRANLSAPATTSVEPSPRPIAHIGGLSPWLASRVKLSARSSADSGALYPSLWRLDSARGDPGDLNMTPTALRELQLSAGKLAQTGQVEVWSGGAFSWSGVAIRLRQFLRGKLGLS